jgi:hypothetical protein
MPEAAIDKNSRFLNWKDEIGAPKEFVITAPADDFIFPEQAHQPKFGGVISL